MARHNALYHHGRWMLDLGIVCLWLGVILIGILVAVPDDLRKYHLGGDWDENGRMPPASSPIVVVGMGATFAQLFSA